MDEAPLNREIVAIDMIRGRIFMANDTVVRINGMFDCGGAQTIDPDEVAYFMVQWPDDEQWTSIYLYDDVYPGPHLLN